MYNLRKIRFLISKNKYLQI